jgi:hypothetical protein
VAGLTKIAPDVVATECSGSGAKGGETRAANRGEAALTAIENASEGA